MESVKSRREEAVDATRQALLDSAVALFSEKGYAATSLDDVTRAARVTKGALYHHFPGGKSAVFQAVFEEVDRRLGADITAAIRPDAGPWELVEDGLDAYLRGVQDPVVRRIMFQDGPVALGHDTYRELDGCASRDLLRAVLQGLMTSGEIAPQPLELMARLLFTVLGEAGMHVSEAAEPEAACAEVRALLLAILRGLKP